MARLIFLALSLLACCQSVFAAGQLYRVTHEGKTSYLYGTVHVGRDGAYPLDDVAARALLDSKALVIELDIREDKAFQLALARHARYAEGDMVQRHLTPDTLQQLTQALARAGIPLSSVQQYKPWLIANLLVSWLLTLVFRATLGQSLRDETTAEDYG